MVKERLKRMIYYLLKVMNVLGLSKFKLMLQRMIKRKLELTAYLSEIAIQFFHFREYPKLKFRTNI